MSDITEAQRIAAEEIYAAPDRWDFHYTDDPVIRYLRDRRLRQALRILGDLDAADLTNRTVLVVCGGVGGEAVFLRRYGIRSVTVSDISENALAICRLNTPEFETRVLDAQDMRGIPDESFDIVLVQDGLHHLSQPTRGFTEMLRVARAGVIVIEPQLGLAGRVLGTTWERHGEAVNYVFRWNRSLVEQVTRSYLGQSGRIRVHRLWDHPLFVHRAVRRATSSRRWQLGMARTLYAILRPLSFAGNAMVAVVVKQDDAAMRPPDRSQAPT